MVIIGNTDLAPHNMVKPSRIFPKTASMYKNSELVSAKSLLSLCLIKYFTMNTPVNADLLPLPMKRSKFLRKGLIKVFTNMNGNQHAQYLKIVKNGMDTTYVFKIGEPISTTSLSLIPFTPTTKVHAMMRLALLLILIILMKRQKNMVSQHLMENVKMKLNAMNGEA
jgi:hypothetical protein